MPSFSEVVGALVDVITANAPEKKLEAPEVRLFLNTDRNKITITVDYDYQKKDLNDIGVELLALVKSKVIV